MISVPPSSSPSIKAASHDQELSSREQPPTSPRRSDKIASEPNNLPKITILDRKVLQRVPLITQLEERFLKARGDEPIFKDCIYWHKVATEHAENENEEFDAALFIEALKISIEKSTSHTNIDNERHILEVYLRSRSHIKEALSLYKTVLNTVCQHPIPSDEVCWTNIKNLIFQTIHDTPDPISKIIYCLKQLLGDTQPTSDAVFYKQTALHLQNIVDTTQKPIPNEEHKNIQTLRIYICYCWFQHFKLSPSSPPLSQASLSLSSLAPNEQNPSEQLRVYQHPALKEAPPYTKLFIHIILCIEREGIKKSQFPDLFLQWHDLVAPKDEITDPDGFSNSSGKIRAAIKTSNQWDLLSKTLLPFFYKSEISFQKIAMCIHNAHSDIPYEKLNTPQLELKFRHQMKRFSLEWVTRHFMWFDIEVMKRHLE